MNLAGGETFKDRLTKILTCFIMCLLTAMCFVSGRIMVGLPSIESRERILKTLLSKEKTEGLDFKELANMTEGYSGSDLKVCYFCFSVFQNIYSIHQ